MQPFSQPAANSSDAIPTPIPPRFRQLNGAQQQQGQQVTGNQLPFPSSEQPQQPQPETMPTHTRTASFFSAFRSNKQSNNSNNANSLSDTTNEPQQQQQAPAVGGSALGPLRTGGGAPNLIQQQTPQQAQQPPFPQNIPSSSSPNPAFAMQPQQRLPPIPQYQGQQQLPPIQHQPPLQMGPVNTTNVNAIARNPSQLQPGRQSQPTAPQQPPASVPATVPTPATPLHAEIRSVVQLTVAHAHKIYFSGPLVRKIERQPDGQKPHKDEGWVDVWAQLGGTTLSVWDMKEIQEASRQGREVPPSYVNVTDAFVQVLGSVTVPATPTSGPKRYTNVLTLNTAGSNLLLFSCPSTAALISWATALRLSAWEKSRLEEIYTAHLIRITLSVRDLPTTLIRGKMEGWAQIRIAGQTDWKRVWMVIAAGSDTANNTNTNSLSRPTSRTGTSPTPNSGPQGGIAPPGTTGAIPRPPPGQQQPQPGGKRRLSNLFSKADPNPTNASIPLKTTLSMYTSMKPKDKKKALMTMTAVTQVFGVYPERPELISRSTLIKVEGMLGDEEMAGTMRSREGWVLIMPDVEGGQSTEMLKWIVALHDAFGLYGRPNAWTWDPRDPVSLMFGYPVGPQKDALFLDRELAESMDPRDDRTSIIRNSLRDMLINYMRSHDTRPTVQAVPQRPLPTNDGPPFLLPIGGLAQNNGNQGPQLPPLSFGNSPPQERPLTPITEGGVVMTHTKSMSVDLMANPNSGGPSSPLNHLPTSHVSHEGKDKPVPPPPTLHNALLDRMMSTSPTNMSPTALNGVPPLSGTTLSSPSRPSLKSTHSSGGSFDKSTGGGFIGYAQANVPLGSGTINTGRPSLDSMTNRSIPNSLSSGNATANVDVNSSSPLAPNRVGSLGLVQSPQQLQQEGSQPLSSNRAEVPLGDKRSRTQETLSTQSGTDGTSDLSYAKDGDLFNNHNAAVRAVAQKKEELPAPAPIASSSPWQHQQESSQNVSTEESDLSGVAAALLYMQNEPDLASGGSRILRQQQQEQEPPQQMISSDDDLDHDYDSTSDIEYQQGREQPVKSDTASLTSNNSRSIPVRKSTPMAFQVTDHASAKSSATASTRNNNSVAGIGNGLELELGSRPAAADRVNPNIPIRTLGRKPSGARAPQTTAKSYAGGGFSSSPHYEEDSENENENEHEDDRMDSRALIHERPAQPQQQQQQQLGQVLGHRPSGSFEAPNDEISAALAYMDVKQHDDKQPTSAPSSPQRAKVTPPSVRSAAVLGGASSSQAISATSESSSAFKSSFVPSKQAEERKKKVQAQQAAHHAAVHKPGRSNGKRKSGMSSAWGESTDEEEDDEEDEDEEEDEDVDSDGARPRPPRMQQMQMQQLQQQQQQQQIASGTGSLRPGLPSLPPQPSMSTGFDQGLPSPADYHPMDGQQGYSNLRPRTLPQIPATRPMPPDGYHPQQQQQQQPPIRRHTSDQYAESGRRTYYDDTPQIRTQAEVPPPGAARQTVWSQVLDSNRNQSGFHAPNEPPQHTRDTFVQLEPSETMTKAFTPQGLLSAGIQDKQDRSAKRQEELARETGASLINVPNKPPPPQTGLLGAITAHERERKRDGGVGAALTEREREKRIVEERQRRFDEHQRLQLDQMQQGGSMYGGGQFGYNPMMGNPMMMGMGMNPMMGMAPMMTGGGMGPMMGSGGAGGGGGGMAPMMTGGGMNPMSMMGYPMMGAFNPQHMFAAQQAAQAYQQAMMAFSVAGSQVGGEGGGGGGVPGQQPLNPNLTGGTMGMGGYDPRMSMNMMGMGIGMMGGPTPQMGNPQMGGNPQMMGMNPQMMNPNPMGTQMTGLSQFDARFGPPNNNNSPGNLSEGGPLPPAGINNSNLAPGMFASNTSSPVGRGSPLARGDQQQQQHQAQMSSRPTTPKH